MKILALEFSTAQRSAAVLSWAKKIPTETGLQCDPERTSEKIETGFGSAAVMGLIEGVLGEANVEPEEIDRVAVGIGPGSYSGVRAAIALAQGWQLARGTPIQGISSMESIAAQCHCEGIRGRMHAVVDAQRGEFYTDQYELSIEGCSETGPLRLVTRAEVELLGSKGEMVAGPEITGWFPRARNVFPRAAIVGGIALSKQNFTAGEKLEPIYLRETSFVKSPLVRSAAGSLGDIGGAQNSCHEAGT